MFLWRHPSEFKIKKKGRIFSNPLLPTNYNNGKNYINGEGGNTFKILTPFF